MHGFDWDKLSAEVGEEEGRKLRPWMVLHYYLWRANRLLALALFLSCAYIGLTMLWKLRPGSSSPVMQDEDWPIFGAIALVCFVATLLLRIAVSCITNRKYRRAQARRAAQTEAGPEPCPSAAPACSPAPPDRPVGEGEAEHLKDEIARLDEQWRWMRDRLGEREWRELTALRNTWMRLLAVRNYSLLVTLFYVALVALELLVKGKPLHVCLAWHPIQVAPFLALLSAAAMWVVLQVVRRRFADLGWRGHSMEAIDRALLAEEAARSLAGYRLEVERQAEETRRQEEPRRRFEQESRTAPPWWQREITGAHAVWWLALLLLVGAPRAHLRLPDAICMAVTAVLVVGGCIKSFLIVYWLIFIASPDSRREAAHLYRWWSKGWLPVAIALLPTLLALIVKLEG